MNARQNEMTNEEAIEQINIIKSFTGFDKDNQMVIKLHKALDMAIELLESQPEDTGEISDGYHTFNQLYHQRAMLFAAIVNQNPGIAWKSFKHSDGNYCFDKNGEWFIVGVDSPEGSYTYHYEKKYWEYFKCKELECGKPWDGHTEEDVTRLLSLESQPCEDVVSRVDVKNEIRRWVGYLDEDMITRINIGIDYLPSITPARPQGKWIGGTICNKCNYQKMLLWKFDYCPKCGAKMEVKADE